MKWIVIAAVATFGAPGTALAECPGHVANLPGVKLIRSEPYMANLYRQTTEGLSEVRVMDRDGTLEEVQTSYLHPLASGKRVSANGTLELVYGADPVGLETLDKTKNWRSSVVLLVNGEPVLEGQIENRLAGIETLTIGDCQTEVWLIENRLDIGEGDGSWMLLSYAPALGLVVGAVTMSADGEPLRRVAFDVIEVQDE